MNEEQARRSPLLLIAIALALRVVLALATDIYPDEAYYWTWGTRPQLSYFDHPGMVGWSIALLGIRFGALFWGALALVGVHRLALALGATKNAAWWATALFASTPAAALLGTINTPDAPLLAFWAWTLDAIVRKRPVLTGVLWGLAMLSKYNGILLGAPVLLVFWRRPLQLVLAGLIALVVTSPTLIWNAQNEWEGFRFQLNHGLGGGGGVMTFLEFLAGQLLMGGPVLAVLSFAWLATRRSVPGLSEPVEDGSTRHLLKLATLLPLVFFGYASWKARGEANWAAAAWIAASVGLAMTPWLRWQRAAAIANVVVLAGGIGLLAFPPKVLWPTPAIQKLHGWKILSRVGEQKVPVFTNRYQLSALATLYGGVESTTFGGRRSQYDLWPRPTLAAGSDALWVGDGEGPPGELLERFERSQPVDWGQDERQQALHPFVVVRLVSYKAPPSSP